MPPSFSDSPRPLFDHLEELRFRLMWIFSSIGLFSIGGYYLSDACLRWLARFTGPMVFLTPTEGFMVKMKLAIILGIFFAIPVLIYHLWRYVGVALTISERRIILGVLPFSYVLFAMGAALGWFVIVPAGLQFLVGFGKEFLIPNLSVDSCLEFSLWITVGLGILFQMPVVIAALAKWGILKASQLRYYRRHSILIILVVAAMITPGPDIVSQLLLATPTYLLFELSIFLAAYLEPKPLDKPSVPVV